MMDSVSVHPFAAVTVTVYVPAELTLVAAVVAPLLQEYVPPPVAVKLILVVVHVRTVVVGAVIAATGAVLFCVIVMDSVSVNPVGPVTVTIYVPGAVTLVVAVVAPLLQEYVPPPVAVKLILGFVQVRIEVIGELIPAVGGKIQFSVNNAIAIDCKVPQLGSIYEYPIVTVVLPVPVKETTSPTKFPGPDTKLNVPPGGEGINVALVPLQYKPFEPEVIEPVNCKSKVVAPQIYTIAVANV